MNSVIRKPFFWITLIVILVAALAGAGYGYIYLQKSNKQESNLRAQFAQLKENAERNRGMSHAEKLASSGNLDAAIKMLETELSNSDTPSVEARLKLAELYAKTGKREDAILQYSLAIELEPENKDALNKQTELLLAEGRKLSACDNLEALLTIDPNDIDTRYRLANMQYENKDYTKASENYSKILVLKGEDAIALQGLGHISLLRNSMGDALSYYERAVEVDPSLGEAWFFVAKINLSNEKYDPAIDAINKAIKLNYPERDLKLWLGAALENTGKIKEAISEYKIFVAENPNHPKTATVKLHISELEFWEAPEHYKSSDRSSGTMKPWEDTITPINDGSKPWNEGTSKP